MKKYIFSLLFFAFTAMNAISQVCCPKFELKTSIPSVCNDLDLKECDSNAVGRIESLRACKNQPHQYLVVPNNPLIYSYHWHVTGGTVVNAAANPATINWGNSSQGILQVIIENADVCIARIAMVNEKPIVFLANFSGIKGSGNAIPFQDSDIELTFRNVKQDAQIVFIPFLGKAQKIEGIWKDGNLKARLPEILRGAIVQVN